MELYLKLIDVLFPVFFVIGIGYYLGKKNPEINTDFITTFAGNVGTPAMIFYTITTTGVTLSVFTEHFISLRRVINSESICEKKVFLNMDIVVKTDLKHIILIYCV